MKKKNINHLELFNKIEGKERQIEFIKEPLNMGTFLPKTLLLEDIDKSFKEWVSSLEIVSDDGKLFPTMSLYSNQRFSEYIQSWKYTDSNNNILLNFKTITRNNNPYFGEIQNKNYNIPGDKFFHMKAQIVQDDNGSESLLKLKMKQPTAIDLVYKLSIFTTNFKHLNTFNVLLNRIFNSRQVYINPNGYYMPMILDGINDESQYNIDDRQFYSQTYDIKVKAYVITEDDYKVEEVPLKIGVSINDANSTNRRSSDVEIEEYVDANGVEKSLITVTFLSKLFCKTKFKMDTNMTVTNVETENISNNIQYFVNGCKIDNIIGYTLKNEDIIKIRCDKNKYSKIAYLKIYGDIIN